MRKVKIGTAGVDSGQLMVTDPCYFEDFKTNLSFEDIRKYRNKKTKKVLQYGKDFSNYEETIREYNKTMNELNASGEWEELPHPHSRDRSYSYRGSCMATLNGHGGELERGRGVVFSTGIGDGSYPVYAYIGEIDGWGERVLKVEIDFNEHVLLD